MEHSSGCWVRTMAPAVVPDGVAERLHRLGGGMKEMAFERAGGEFGEMDGRERHFAFGRLLPGVVAAAI